MSALKDLNELPHELNPRLIQGEYVFVSVPDGETDSYHTAIARIREKEGWSLVMPRKSADQLNLSYDYVAAWITLEVSSLHSVGLTAVVSHA